MVRMMAVLGTRGISPASHSSVCLSSLRKLLTEEELAVPKCYLKALEGKSNNLQNVIYLQTTIIIIIIIFIFSTIYCFMYNFVCFVMIIIIIIDSNFV